MSTLISAPSVALSTEVRPYTRHRRPHLGRFAYPLSSVTSSTRSASASSLSSLVAQLSRGYFGWLAGTILGVAVGLGAEGTIRAVPIGWAVAMVGLFLAVCAVGVVAARLLGVALVRRMQRRPGTSEHRSFRLQVRESLRAPIVIEVLKAVGTSALVAITLTSSEVNLSQVAVLLTVVALLVAFIVAILVLEIWVDPELSTRLPRPRRRAER